VSTSEPQARAEKGTEVEWVMDSSPFTVFTVRMEDLLVEAKADIERSS
jgi:hypothetical protein